MRAIGSSGIAAAALSASGVAPHDTGNAYQHSGVTSYG
ncbi:hypothetical protein SXCC_02999 [Gluconacetobacter sp. SXCC-1]|nr:hypothetical protein SXCC_02999 [Gluconacetobacter sp. SXCC-1]